MGPTLLDKNITLDDGTIVNDEALREMARLSYEAWRVGGLEYQRQRAHWLREMKPWREQRDRQNYARQFNLPFKEKLLTRPEHSFEGFVYINEGWFPEEHVWTFEELYRRTKDSEGHSRLVGLIAWYVLGDTEDPVSLGRKAIHYLREK